MEELTEILKGQGIKCIQDGFDTLPKDHIFAVWRIAHRRAQGADGYNMYWDVTFELRIFYRDRKTEADRAWEKGFEENMRGLNELESDYDYNPDDKLDITVYKFIGREDL